MKDGVLQGICIGENPFGAFSAYWYTGQEEWQRPPPRGIRVDEKTLSRVERYCRIGHVSAMPLPAPSDSSLLWQPAGVRGKTNLYLVHGGIVYIHDPDGEDASLPQRIVTLRAEASGPGHNETRLMEMVRVLELPLEDMVLEVVDAGSR